MRQNGAQSKQVNFGRVQEKFEATKKLSLSSLDSPKQQLVLVQTMVVELVPVVEGGARGLQHHEAFLCA